MNTNSINNTTNIICCYPSCQNAADIQAMGKYCSVSCACNHSTILFNNFIQTGTNKRNFDELLQFMTNVKISY